MSDCLNKSSNSTNRKRKAQSLRLLRRKLPSKPLHFRGPYRQQNWPFKYTLINYITKSPSNAKAWQKLIQSCKYFFAKNPIIVADRLDFRQGWEICAGRLQKRIPTNIVSYKLWTAKTLRIYGTNPNCVSSVMPQIYRCDATKLILYGQILSYNEFLFFSRNVEILHLDYSRVKNPNVTVATNPESAIVPLEKLVKTLVKLKEIMGKNNPTHSFITKNTARELSENPNFSNIYEMTLYRISEVFDIDTFFIYLKKNKYTKFQLHFAGSISEEHKVRLEKIVDEILQTKYHDYKPPLITFDGLAAEKLCKLQDLFNDIRFSY